MILLSESATANLASYKPSTPLPTATINDLFRGKCKGILWKFLHEPGERHRGVSKIKEAMFLRRGNAQNRIVQRRRSVRMFNGALRPHRLVRCQTGVGQLLH